MATITSAQLERSDTRCPACGNKITDEGCEGSQACTACLPDLGRQTLPRFPNLATQRGLDPAAVLLAGLEALDLLGIGWVVCSSTGQAVLINRSAKHILESRDGLELDAKGILRTTQTGKNTIQRIVRCAARAGRDSSAMLVPRLSGKRPFTVFVHPVERTISTGRSTQPRAIVLVMNPELVVDVAPAELHQLYGLTPTETRLTNALMNGKSLQKSCVDLGITALTGRSHLDSVFAKTGVRRQVQLISLVLKSIGMARVGNKKTLN